MKNYLPWKMGNTMRKRDYSLRNKVLLLICLLLMSGCRPETQKQGILIATAANMQFVMEELSQRFSEKTGIPCDLVISSSGKLTAQIKAGAPFDVFVSANMAYPEEVFQSGFATAAPKIYAYGQLVLWSMQDKTELSLEALTDPSIQHIAIANPQTAPYGAAALDVLKHQNLFDPIQDKLVYGESIAQTNQFILSQSADIGITAMSVVLSQQLKGKGQWIEIDPESYDPIGQGVVVVRRSERNSSDAEAFSQYLFSEEAQSVLGDFGYLK